jgi:hypothetical protein
MLIQSRTSIENGTGNVDDIRWQAVMAHRIFGDKFQERRILEIVATFKYDALRNDLGVLDKKMPKALDVAIVEQVNGPTKRRVLNPLMMRTLECRRARVLHERPQAGPAGEPVLARDGELRVGQRERHRLDSVVRHPLTAGVELSNSLACLECAGLPFVKQILRLAFQMIEAWLRRKTLGRHVNSPFARVPVVRIGRQKGQFVDRPETRGWTRSFPRTGCAPQRNCTEGEHILGRDPELELFFDSTSVSRRHARIRVAGTSATIEDLGSKNGTFIGDRRVDTIEDLADGDTGRIGSIVLRMSAVRTVPTTETTIQPFQRG